VFVEALAREAARQDIVLLENRNFLPLDLASGMWRVAVIGPSANATKNVLGDYSPTPPYVVTPLDALSEIVPGKNILFAPGCNDVSCTNQSFFPAAVQAAKNADVAILFMGTNIDYESEGILAKHANTAN